LRIFKRQYEIFVVKKNLKNYDSIKLKTYHIDLTHSVDQDDGKRGDGESEDKTLRNVPQDDAEAEGEQQHQHHGHPREGSEEKN
jgi:hypothetical protein